MNAIFLASWGVFYEHVAKVLFKVLNIYIYGKIWNWLFMYDKISFFLMWMNKFIL